MLATTLVKNANQKVEKLFGEGDDILKGLVRNQLLFNDPNTLAEKNEGILDEFRYEQQAIQEELRDADMVFVHDENGNMVQKSWSNIIDEFINPTIDTGSNSGTITETNPMHPHVKRRNFSRHTEHEVLDEIES